MKNPATAQHRQGSMAEKAAAVKTGQVPAAKKPVYDPDPMRSRVPHPDHTRDPNQGAKTGGAQ